MGYWVQVAGMAPLRNHGDFLQGSHDLRFGVARQFEDHPGVLLKGRDHSVLGKEARSSQAVQEEVAPNESLHCG